jgi:putative DNA-invertase from lambdoid prophage Rac
VELLILRSYGRIMKTAAYLRVSSAEQHSDNQLPAIIQWIKSHNGELVEVYAENESAWKAGHQKELARLLDELRSGRRKYDTLVVWALDRLSRQGAASILNLINTFKAYGVHVISLNESWTELPGELGEVLFAIAGWVARMESERRSERTRAGLARVRAQGKKLGRPPGAKDKDVRRKSGYINRWLNKRPVANEPRAVATGSGDK